MKSWVAWLLAAVFYGYQNVLRNIPNYFLLDMVDKYGVDPDMLGQYAGIYYIAYAGFHIPVGIMLDKYGPRYVVMGSILCTVLGVLPMILSDQWLMVYLGRILIGVGSSAAFIGLFKVIHLEFSEGKRAALLGIGATVGLLFPVIFSTIFATLRHELSLNFILYMGVGLAVLSVIFLPISHQQKSESSIINSLKLLWKHKIIFCIAMLGGIMIGPLEGFSDACGAMFIEQVYGVDHANAMVFQILILIGMAIGTSSIPYIAARTKQYYSIVILAAIVMTIAFVTLYLIQLPELLLALMLVIIGFFCAYQVIVIYKTASYVSEGLVGLVAAITNMIMMAFGFVFHTFIGRMLLHLWDGTIVNNAPVFSAHSYVVALSIIPVGLALGGLGFCYIRVKTKEK